MLYAAQAATNTKEVADRTGDAAVQMAKEVAPKIKPAADRFSEQAESAAQRVAEEAPRRIDKASEVRNRAGVTKKAGPQHYMRQFQGLTRQAGCHVRVIEGQGLEMWLLWKLRMPCRYSNCVGL